jgi:hypothetical protein
MSGVVAHMGETSHALKALVKKNGEKAPGKTYM